MARALNKVVIIAFACFALAVLLLEYFYHKQNQLYQCQYTLQQAQVSLLTIRRHEKDYLARRQVTYKEQLFDSVEQLNKETNYLKKCSSLSRANIEQLNKISHLLKLYQDKFIATIREIDIRPQQELSQLNLLMVKQKELEKQAKEFNISFFAQLIGLRERLLAYISEDDHQVLADIQQTLSRLQKWQGVSDKLKQSLEEFSSQIQSIDDLMKVKRLAHERGTMKAMRTSAHQIETHLESTQAQLNNRLNDWQFSRWLSYCLLLVALVLLRSTGPRSST